MKARSSVYEIERGQIHETVDRWNNKQKEEQFNRRRFQAGDLTLLHLIGSLHFLSVVRFDTTPVRNYCIPL